MTYLLPGTEYYNSNHEWNAAVATCTTDGNIEYWARKTWGKLFWDEAGTNEITLADTVVAATGNKASNAP
ncbi:MAG: hypothetical protein IKF90_11995 [Parasporobacterium sp.]|nr:hypothetical protein [Parasporobacterium sp.]